MKYYPPELKLLNVIQVTTNRGKGENGDPIRNVDFFYDAATGDLIFIRDQYLIDQQRKQEVTKATS